MVSVMNQTRRYLHENRMDIADLQRASSALTARVLRNMKQAEGLAKTIDKLHIRHHVRTIIDKVDRSIHLYLHQVGLFHRQRLQLERGYLTDEILPPAYLQDILRQLGIKKHETAPPRWHYQHVPVVPLLDSGTELSFRAIIPGLAREKYHLYSLQYFPVPLGSGMLRQVTGKNEIALDEVSSASFTPTACAGSMPAVCRVDQELLQPTCEANLLMGRRPLNCIISVTPRRNQTSSITSGDDEVSSVILSAFLPIEATLHCPDRTPITKTYSGLNRIALGPGCVLQSNEWRVRGIDLGQSTITLPHFSYIQLPSLNLTFSEVKQQELFKQLQFKNRLDIPMISRDLIEKYKPLFDGWSPLQTGTVTGAPVILLFVVVIAILCVYYKIVGFKTCRKKVQEPMVHPPEISDPLLPLNHNQTYNQNNYHFNRRDATPAPAEPFSIPERGPSAPLPEDIALTPVTNRHLKTGASPSQAIMPSSSSQPKEINSFTTLTPPIIPEVGPLMKLAGRDMSRRPQAVASALYGPRGFDATWKAQRKGTASSAL